MKNFFSRFGVWVFAVIAFFSKVYAQENVEPLNWNNIKSVSKTTATLQVVENPMVRPNSPIHKKTFEALKNLGADYVRYVPWFPYPKMAVAELRPPTKDSTFWDFTYLDSTMAAVMEATKCHSTVINFSTTPAWMWKTKAPVKYPDDPYQTSWDYNQGTQLKDTTCKQLADYYVRLFSWYTKGGFTDELGKFRQSGHHYSIPFWEVLNEPDLEHNISPELYTRIYDAIVKGIKKISPQTKFIGMSLAFETNPHYFEYFLNPKNHDPGITLEGISYHFYGGPSWDDQELSEYQYTFFEKADAFIDRVRYIENIRKRLAPQVFTTINEIGTILRSPQVYKPIDPAYWNVSGGMYTYVLLNMMKLGIDVAGESQLVGYPTQFPDVSMMNWESAKPNARYWILKLLKDNFGPGDKLVDLNINAGDVVHQGFITNEGKKILLINKKNNEVKLNLPAGVKGSWVSYVDTATGDNEPGKVQLTENSILLKPFSVAVIKLDK